MVGPERVELAAEMGMASGLAPHLPPDLLEGAENCVTWADALQIAVGRLGFRALGGQALVRPEVG